MSVHNIFLPSSEQKVGMLNKRVVKNLDFLTDSTASFDNDIRHFFSHTNFFISETAHKNIVEAIDLIESVVRNKRYIQSITASHPYPPTKSELKGILNCYDFHLEDDTPKLIEINTNAGGALLNVDFIQKYESKYPSYLNNSHTSSSEQIKAKIIDMFLTEWKLTNNTRPLKTVAIVDQDPKAQFLYPEFFRFKNLLSRQGIVSYIVAPEELTCIGDNLYYQSTRIDMIYNRMTDFLLEEKYNEHIKQSYASGAVALSPNPYLYTIYADKRNLVTLSDKSRLSQLGICDKSIARLSQYIPNAVLITHENEQNLWKNKSRYFFKPIHGFGSKAAYKGSKLTKKTWQAIIHSNYIAQNYVEPSVRIVQLDDKFINLKADLRAYVYDGKLLFLAARLFRGQTTNFRTFGGGFSVVHPILDKNSYISNSVHKGYINFNNSKT
ncbi:hypothetical protein NBRC116591_04920 [Sessilibacter corallicola]|uniref:Circularly permuted type 2 ATP-grasp protein n=2 Tax=Sessilibacter corallicola TaxID=2904075 RepID=A0ABQ0A4V8_9GAMM